MQLDVAAPIVEITSPTLHTSVNSGIPVTLTATASAGTITWYESDVPFATGDSVTVTLSDGTHQISAIATDDAGRIGMAGVVIDVGLPVAVNDTANTSTDTPVTIDVLANDSDPDDDPLSVIEVSEPRNGTAVINPDDTITYTPNAEFTGTDRFSYTIGDGKGGTDSAWVSVEVVESPNQLPAAQDDLAATDEDVLVVVNVLTNDSDPDPDDVVQIDSVGQGTNGSVFDNGDGTVKYTPDADFNGSDSFTYAVGDGNGGFDTATVTVNVNPQPDAPVAMDDSATADEATAVDVQVLDNDYDVDNQSLTITSVSNVPAGCSVDNNVTYLTFTAAAAGTYTFDYTVDDGTDRTATASVTMTVAEPRVRHRPLRVRHQLCAAFE